MSNLSGKENKDNGFLFQMIYGSGMTSGVEVEVRVELTR
jgi:hypothetical protein